MGVQAESLLMTYPGRHWVKSLVGQFRQTPDNGYDTKDSEYAPWVTESEVFYRSSVMK